MTIASKQPYYVWKNDKTNGEVINIGVGKPTTILDLAEKIIKLSNRKLKPQFVHPRKYEIKHRFPDVSKMRELINFTPEFDLEEGQGLRRTIKWYKTQK